jgi:hypothetical protein
MDFDIEDDIDDDYDAPPPSRAASSPARPLWAPPPSVTAAATARWAPPPSTAHHVDDG